MRALSVTLVEVGIEVMMLLIVCVFFCICLFVALERGQLNPYLTQWLTCPSFLLRSCVST